MKFQNIVLCGLLWGLIYFGTNSISLFAAHELPLFSFEKEIQMSEWWMIPYVSWTLYIVVFCLLIKREARKFILLGTILVLIHAVIFIFLPVEYPRTYNLDALCSVNKFLLSCDNPRNCLPSLHVSLIFFTLLIASYLGISKKFRYLLLIWGTIIMASVIFVKQHYAIDVCAGLLLTGIFFFIMKKTLKPKLIGSKKTTQP